MGLASHAEGRRSPPQVTATVCATCSVVLRKRSLSSSMLLCSSSSSSSSCAIRASRRRFSSSSADLVERGGGGDGSVWAPYTGETQGAFYPPTAETEHHS